MYVPALLEKEKSNLILPHDITKPLWVQVGHDIKQMYVSDISLGCYYVDNPVSCGAEKILDAFEIKYLFKLDESGSNYYTQSATKVFATKEELIASL